MTPQQQERATELAILRYGRLVVQDTSDPAQWAVRVYLLWRASAELLVGLDAWISLARADASPAQSAVFTVQQTVLDNTMQQIRKVSTCIAEHGRTTMSDVEDHKVVNVNSLRACAQLPLTRDGGIIDRLIAVRRALLKVSEPPDTEIVTEVGTRIGLGVLATVLLGGTPLGFFAGMVGPFLPEVGAASVAIGEKALATATDVAAGVSTAAKAAVGAASGLAAAAPWVLGVALLWWVARK